jgi:hypothetical protein
MKSSKTKAGAPTPKPPAAEAEAAVPFDQVLRKLVDSKAAGTAAPKGPVQRNARKPR